MPHLPRMVVLMLHQRRLIWMMPRNLVILEKDWMCTKMENNEIKWNQPHYLDLCFHQPRPDTMLDPLGYDTLLEQCPNNQLGLSPQSEPWKITLSVTVGVSGMLLTACLPDTGSSGRPPTDSWASWCRGSSWWPCGCGCSSDARCWQIYNMQELRTLVMYYVCRLL